MGTVLLAHVLPAEERRAPPGPLPLVDGAVDVVALLRRAVAAFAPARIEAATAGRRAPHALTYLCELAAVLHSWAVLRRWTEPSGVVAFDVLGDARAALVLRPPDAEALAIEVLASCPAGGPAGVEARRARAEEHSHSYRDARSVACCVVHFIAAWPPAPAPPGHCGGGAVPLVTVYHDVTFTNVAVIADGQ